MFLISAMALAVTATHAQQLWPTADSATIKASEFADTTQIFWQQTGGAAPAAGFTGWVTRGLTVSGTANKDSARWVWRRDASASGGQYYGGFTFLASPSRLNGAAVFNSDFLDLTGTTSPHSGELVSPKMDLTGKSGFVVQFNQLYRNFQSQTLVSYSKDDGATWSAPIDMNSDIGVNTVTPDPADKTQTNVTIKRVKLAGSVGSATFRIKFTFTGNYYFMIMDDVKIIDVPYDLQMTTFYAVPHNSYTPKEQGEPTYFLADIKNAGREAMKNVKLSVNVWRAADNVNVFNTESTQYPTSVVPDTTVENRLLPKSLNISTLNVGAYYGSYRVSGDSSRADAIPGNDSVRFTFVVSDTTAALSVIPAGTTLRSNYTKENANLLQSGNAASYWEAGEAKTWRVGNVYRINKGKGKSLSSIVARLNPFLVAGKSLLGAIYEWNDANNDKAIQPTERNLVAFGEVPIAATVANANAWWTFKLQDLNTNKDFEAKDSTTYLAVIEIDPAVSNTVLPTIVFNNVFNYGPSGATWFVADSLNIRPPYSIILGKTATTDWQLGGYTGVNYVPCVRLNVTSFMPTDIKTILSDDNKVTIYPNPSNGTDMLMADVELVEKSEALVSIMTMDGKHVSESVVDAMQKTQVQIDVSEYAAGMYIFKITTAKGIMTKRFVVAK
ncbi:MAG: T9SS type A sorting domain-containing protein [Saprospiraceae bacterium]|nr:T9SS type A sorting domain-containing protein [Saprospiraceae bacterium]